MQQRHNSFLVSASIAAALVVAGGVLVFGSGPATEVSKDRAARGGTVAEQPSPSPQPINRIARGAQTAPDAEQLAMSSTGQAEAGQPLRLPRGG